MDTRRLCTLLTLAGSLALPLSSRAQGSMQGGATAAGGSMVAPAQVFNKLLSNEESEFVAAAEAMPADKFNFAPTGSGKFDGVRTYAQEIKHVTEANYAFFRGFGVSGGKSRGDIESLSDRDQILAALRQSFQYAHSAIATITAANAFTAMDGNGTTRAGLAVQSISHPQDHYGQMVEYLRMNGIIPPASRR